MQVDLKPDFEVSGASCKSVTGKTFTEWSAALDAAAPATRRDAIQFLYDNAKDAWWATTIWVECERANGKFQKDGRIEGYNICVTKTIAQPIDKVYAAWTKSPDAWFEDGAKFEENGRIEDSLGNGGELLRVRPNKDLRFAWKTAGGNDGSQVDVMFADKGGKTGITLNHGRIQTRAEADGLRKAWGEALDRLKKQQES
jgi:uncharacterized protein YndB with AHSA1/START domain